MKKKSRKLLFITHAFKITSDAYLISALSREKAFKKIGLKVKFLYFKGERFNFLSEFLKILRFIKKIDIVYIRVDGSSILEKFSLLKLFNHRLLLIWEIHASVEEAFWDDRSLRAEFIILKRNFKRKILSKLVDGSICVPKELKIYSEKQLGIKKNFVIPNFIDRALFTRIINSHNHQRETSCLFLNNKRFFKVFWGGGAQYKWQALDIIEKVAQKIYQLDKSIIFFIIGSDKWHQFTFMKNIISLDSLSREKFLNYLLYADVCLALSHKDRRQISGSPTKLIEYMALGKPVVSTDIWQVVKEIIEDKENGFLTNNNVDDIAQKILFLKKNPRFAKKMGRKAQETVFKNYSLEQAVQQYKKAFEKLDLL